MWNGLLFVNVRLDLALIYVGLGEAVAHVAGAEGLRTAWEFWLSYYKIEAKHE